MPANPPVVAETTAITDVGQTLVGEVLEALTAIGDPSVGPSTILTGGVTIGGFVAGGVAILTGSRDIDTITMFVIGVIGLISFIVTRVTQALQLNKIVAQAALTARVVSS